MDARDYPAGVCFDSSTERRETVAFTLIELLLVIVVISILASLPLSALTRAKASACSVKCKGNLRQIDLALQIYVSEAHAYPLEDPLFPFANAGKRWFGYLEPILNSNWTNDVFRCPAYKGNRIGMDPVAGRRVGCYGYNDWGVYPANISPETPPLPRFGLGLSGVRQLNMPLPESEIAVPSDMIAMGDAFRAADTNVVYENDGFGRDFQTIPNADGAKKAARIRHFGTLNVGFCDGHVSALKIERLFGPTSEDRRRWNVDHQSHQ